MNSSSGGSSEPEVAPAFSWVPERVGTAGDNVADLMMMFGLALDGTQRTALDALCSVKSEEPFRWAALEGAIVEPRQNGKSVGVLMPLAIFSALKTSDQLVVWSAHRYKTSREAFLAMLKLYRRSPRFKAKVQRVVYSNGEEAFEFKNGSRIIFVARSQASGRGLSGDVVILDEALFLTVEMMGALFPTLSARENPLVLYASSAGIASSDVLRGIRDRGRPGGDPSLAYLEWCAAAGCDSDRCEHEVGAVGCACDDPRRWRAANPSPRVTIEYIAAERRAMPPAEFARERLGWWDEPDLHGRVISAPRWDDCRDFGSTSTGKVAVALDVSPDRSMASVAWCGLNADGLPHVEVVRNEPGTAWLVDTVVAMAADVACVVVDSAGAAASLLPALEAAGLEVTKASAANMTQACGAFYDAVLGKDLRHIGQPPLDAALAGARKRELAAAWAWNRKDSTVDLTPLVAVTLALWGYVKNSPRVYDPLESVL